MAYDGVGLFKLITVHMTANPSLSLAQLEGLIMVERHTIERIIKIRAGVTFRQFRSKLLLHQAVTLLATHPNQPIKCVALMLGYGSQRSFCRFVKMHTGKSPKAIRSL